MTTDSKVLADGYAYWQSTLLNGPAPTYASFEPMTVPGLLPNVILLRPDEDGADFQYRVIGEAVLHHLLGNYTGKWVSELPHQAPPSQIHDNLTSVYQTKAPLWADTPYVGRHERFFSKSELLLPYVDDAGNVSRILVLLDFVSN